MWNIHSVLLAMQYTYVFLLFFVIYLNKDPDAPQLMETTFILEKNCISIILKRFLPWSIFAHVIKHIRKLHI